MNSLCCVRTVLDCFSPASSPLLPLCCVACLVCSYPRGSLVRVPPAMPGRSTHARVPLRTLVWANSARRLQRRLGWRSQARAARPWLAVCFLSPSSRRFVRFASRFISRLVLILCARPCASRLPLFASPSHAAAQPCCGDMQSLRLELLITMVAMGGEKKKTRPPDDVRLPSSVVRRRRRRRLAGRD